MRKTLLAILLLMPLAVFASATEPLDKAPIRAHDKESLQRGAKYFVNYCLNCHSAQYMRYNQLTQIGLSESQIKSNLIFGSEKIGDTMKIAAKQADAKEWFGVAPPDLSVVARSRGADWLYTYLRGFYRDDSTPTGWNNKVFDKVAMPHVLYQLQGVQVLKSEKVMAHGEEHIEKKLVLEKPGTLTQRQYNQVAADLVNFLVYVGEPAKAARIRLGYAVLAFLAVFLIIAYVLKKEYWKDVH